MPSQPTRYGRVSPTRRLSADLATLHRNNPLEYNSLPLDRSARRQHRRKQHQQQQQHRRLSEQNLPDFGGGGGKFKQHGSSSSSEDVRAASEDRLLAPPMRPWMGVRSELLPAAVHKKSSVGGRRKMREEQRRREKKEDGTSRKTSAAKRVSASVPTLRISPLGLAGRPVHSLWLNSRVEKSSILPQGDS